MSKELDRLKAQEERDKKRLQDTQKKRRNLERREKRKQEREAAQRDREDAWELKRYMQVAGTYKDGRFRSILDMIQSHAWDVLCDTSDPRAVDDCLREIAGGNAMVPIGTQSYGGVLCPASRTKGSDSSAPDAGAARGTEASPHGAPHGRGRIVTGGTHVPGGSR